MPQQFDVDQRWTTVTVRCWSGVLGPGFNSLGWVLTSGKPMPWSRASISGDAAWFCVGVSTDGVPYLYGRNLDSNDVLLLHRLYSFILYVALLLYVCIGFGVALEDDHSHMGERDDMYSQDV